MKRCSTNCDMATRTIVEMALCGYLFRSSSPIQASMLGGNVAGSAHYYCCQLSFCWLVACQSCGPLQLHWGMSSSWGESKKCFEAQDGWLFFWGAYGTRSILTNWPPLESSLEAASINTTQQWTKRYKHSSACGLAKDTLDDRMWHDMTICLKSKNTLLALPLKSMLGWYGRSW